MLCQSLLHILFSTESKQGLYHPRERGGGLKFSSSIFETANRRRITFRRRVFASTNDSLDIRDHMPLLFAMNRYQFYLNRGVLCFMHMNHRAGDKEKKTLLYKES